MRLTPEIPTVARLLDEITARVRALGSVEAGPGAVATRVVTRAGLPVTKVGELPAKVFVLVGKEVYMYPTDTAGEVFAVPLPGSGRSVKVEVLSHTPQLLLVRNFLSPGECEEVIREATPKMEPSTVLKQGDQSDGEHKVPNRPCKRAHAFPAGR